MKASKRLSIVALSLFSLGSSAALAGQSDDQFTVCKEVKLVTEGRANVVLICEKQEEAPRVSILNSRGRS